jgi:hypothetical protein
LTPLLVLLVANDQDDWRVKNEVCDIFQCVLNRRLRYIVNKTIVEGYR